MKERDASLPEAVTLHPAPSKHVDRAEVELDATERATGENDGSKRRENENHALHVEKTPFVELVWSSPIPLATEERCPLRSFHG